MIINRVHDVVRLAESKFWFRLPKIEIHFDITELDAGLARRENGIYSIHFNNTLIMTDMFDHVHDLTVPHEVAHIITFMFCPFLGDGHNFIWRWLCIKLGGDGNIMCRLPDAPEYKYVTVDGWTITVPFDKHMSIQHGSDIIITAGDKELCTLNKSNSHYKLNIGCNKS